MTLKRHTKYIKIQNCSINQNKLHACLSDDTQKNKFIEGSNNPLLIFTMNSFGIEKLIKFKNFSETFIKV